MRRRRSNRSRRIVKKLLKRAVRDPLRDAFVADGKRWISAVEIIQHGLNWTTE